MSQVRPLDTDEALRLDLPHAVMLRVDDSWNAAWLLGHDRDGDTVMFLVQLLDDATDQQPMWLSDAVLGESTPGYGTATG